MKTLSTCLSRPPFSPTRKVLEAEERSRRECVRAALRGACEEREMSIEDKGVGVIPLPTRVRLLLFRQSNTNSASCGIRSGCHWASKAAVVKETLLLGSHKDSLVISFV